jgi:hypothetical protein
MIRSWLLSDSCRFVDLGRPLWREHVSTVCNCYWPTRSNFTLSDLRLPFSSPPTTRRVTVEVFDPAPTLMIARLCLMLRPTVSRPLYLEIKHPYGTYDQIFIISVTVTVLFCGVPSLTRGWVCLLYMLLAVVSTVFLGTESLGTREHILPSQIWDFPFRRLRRLAGSRWRYSIRPPQGEESVNHRWTSI